MNIKKMLNKEEISTPYDFGEVRNSVEAVRNVSFGALRNETPATYNQVEEEDIKVQSHNINNFEESSKLYSDNLASMTEEHLGLMHSMNMNDLEAFNKKIMDSMTVLKKAAETKKSTDFGHATFKTDA